MDLERHVQQNTVIRLFRHIDKTDLKKNKKNPQEHK